MFFNVVVHIFSMLQYIFFVVAVHIFSMLQYMFFNITLHIFLMLQYLQPDVALHSFSTYFCNIAVEVLHALLAQRHGGGTGYGEERGDRSALGSGGMAGFDFYSVPCA
jgi:hypothetical protein